MKHHEECHMDGCTDRTKDHIYMDFHRCTCPQEDTTSMEEKIEVEEIRTFCHLGLNCPEMEIKHFMELNHAPTELLKGLTSSVPNPYRSLTTYKEELRGEIQKLLNQTSGYKTAHLDAKAGKESAYRTVLSLLK